jgi:hypothetical protein
MSASWNHLVCELCWEKFSRPGVEPHRVIRLQSEPVKPCCFCGTWTASGILVRQNPRTVACLGVNGIHAETSQNTHRESGPPA